MLMMAVAPAISAGAKSGISKSGLASTNLDRSVKPPED